VVVWQGLVGLGVAVSARGSTVIPGSSAVRSPFCRRHARPFGHALLDAGALRRAWTGTGQPPQPRRLRAASMVCQSRCSSASAALLGTQRQPRRAAGVRCGGRNRAGWLCACARAAAANSSTRAGDRIPRRHSRRTILKVPPHCAETH
jgi:hypothetical protein